MKRFILGIILNVLLISTYCQTTYKTKEVKITYSNAIELFNICLKNPPITFDEGQVYTWYTEFSNVKSTKGGCGGNLLHGNYKLYDKEGNLKEDNNYYLGVKSGEFKTWDSIGNLQEIYKYNKGKCIYHKFLNDNDQWVELIGSALITKGVIRKIYSKSNILLEEDVAIKDFVLHKKMYYLNGKLHQEFTQDEFLDICRGKFVSYYDNEQIEVEAEYCEDSPIEIRTGTWKWYSGDGSLLNQEEYKAEVIKYESGRTRSAGGYLFDEDSQQWLKTGRWVWYNENHAIINEKEYENGIEISILK